MTELKALDAAELRAIVRKNANILGILTDTVECGYAHPYDDAVAVAARKIVDYPTVVWDVVSLGAQRTIADIQGMDWRDVVIEFAEIVEKTRESFRGSWQSGFLKRILYGELEGHSSHVREMTL